METLTGGGAVGVPLDEGDCVEEVVESCCEKESFPEFCEGAGKKTGACAVVAGGSGAVFCEAAAIPRQHAPARTAQAAASVS